MSKKPRIRVSKDNKITAVNGVTMDGISNVITALGSSNVKVAANRYVVSDNWHEIDNAFRSSTWYRKIATIPAEDAVREWRAWQASKEQIEKLEKFEKRKGIRKIIFEAILTSRHAGGAAIMIGGLPGKTEEPLNLNDVREDSIKWLAVLGPQEISPRGMIRDPESEWFGQPEHWTITSEGHTQQFHPSRIIPVNGRRVPGKKFTQTNTYWGDSIWIQMADAITASDTSASVIEALMHETKVDVVRIKGFIDQVSDSSAESEYIRRWTMVAMLKSISNVMMLDGEDEWEQKQINWSGLPEVTRTLLTIMAGAADIPVTRLLGEQGAGLSGSDMGSLRHYYDSISSMQELEYAPALAPLDEIIIRSALGSRDESIWYSWNPLWSMSEKERAEVDKLEAEAVQIYVNTGLIPQDALAQLTQNRLIESESWPGAEAAYDASKADFDLPEFGEGGEGEGVTEETMAAAEDKPQDAALNGAQISSLKGIVESVAQGTLPKETAVQLIMVGFPAIPEQKARKILEDIEEGTQEPTEPAVQVPPGDEDDEDEQSPIPAADAAPRTLYVRRDVVNAAQIIAHFKNQGFETTLPEDDMHVTIAFSRQPVDWMRMGENFSSDQNGNVTIQAGGPRMMDTFGEAKVLMFASSNLSWRHEDMKRQGATWDHPEYQPHITISYEFAGDLSAVEPWTGEIVLGPEIFEEIDEDWKEGVTEDQQ